MMIDKNGKEITNYDIQKEMWGRLVNKKEPHIAHSDLTGEIYVIVGKDKYKITEQAKKAVKAVEQEPCEDAISRTYLLKKFEDRFIELQKAHQKEKQLGINWCINTLKDMPPVKPTQKWIPVNERLPEENGFYLATYDGEICGENEPFTGLAEYENGKWVDDEEDYQCVLAWLPLPKPYKGESEVE